VVKVWIWKGDAAYKALNRLRKLLRDCVTNELAHAASRQLPGSLASGLLNPSPAFLRVSSFPAQTLISVVKLRRQAF
jgi:hypothetical protein